MNSDYRRTNLLPLAQLAVAFATGVLLGQPAPSLTLILAASLLSASGALTFLILQRRLLATISLLLAFMFSGTSLALLEMHTAEPGRVKRLLEEGLIDSHRPVEVTGVLQRNPEFSWNNIYLTLRVEQITVKGTDKLASGVVTFVAPLSENRNQLDHLALRYGARVRVMTRLERADAFRNPGVSRFSEYLNRKGYDATGFIKSVRLIERLDDEPVFLPLAWIYDWRNELQEEFDSRLARETAGVLDAALLGNRYNLSRATAERFRDGGTFHVLVISGLHITFLGGVVFIITRRITRIRTTQFLASAAVVWAYSIAVGAEPSIVRAALMFTVVTLAPVLARRSSPVNGLGAVAIVMLTWTPSSLLDPSFQLTFVSVLAILVIAWPLLNNLSLIGSWRPARVTPYPPSSPGWLRRLSEAMFWDERDGELELRRANYSYKLFKSPLGKKLQRFYLQRVLRFSCSAFVVSVSVQMALLPFLVVYFHRFSIASFVLNIFVSIVMAGVALAALIGVAVAQVSPVLAEPPLAAANVLNWGMVHSVDPFAQTQIASTRLPEYTGWPAALYVIYYAPLAILASCLWKWKPLDLVQSRAALWKRKVGPLALAGQLLVVTLVIFHPFSAFDNDGKLRVDFLDVGQGDAALITFPDNTTILVDGGGKPGPFRFGVDGDEEFEQRDSRSIGESVVSEYLWWRGLDRIDYLVVTHADADHIDGLNDIVRNFNVRAALVARVTSHDPEFAKLSQSLAANNVPIRTVGAGDELRVGKVFMDVLWPAPSADSALSSRNDDSVVLRLRFGSRTVLLTGDIESRSESALLGHYQNSLAADLTKVAHHGSRTSSTESFVTAVQSDVAIISVGESSVFGHPHEEVVERWKVDGAQVLTTGKSGMITFITDGHDMQVTTFVNSR